MICNYCKEEIEDTVLICPFCDAEIQEELGQISVSSSQHAKDINSIQPLEWVTSNAGQCNICSYCKEENFTDVLQCPHCDTPINNIISKKDYKQNKIDSNINIEEQFTDFKSNYTLPMTMTSIGLVLVHYQVFRFIPLFMLILYIPIMAGVWYFIYIKFIRSKVKNTSRQLSLYTLKCSLLTAIVYQVLLYKSVAISAISSIVTTASAGFPVPFLHTAMNYRIKQQGLPSEFEFSWIVALNVIPAIEILFIVIIFYLAVRISKTTYELQQEGASDPFAKSSGVANTLNIGLSQVTLAMRKKDNFDIKSIENKELRQELEQYDAVSAKEFCTSCHYIGPMGIVKTYVPWYFSWWFLIALGFTGIGMIVMMIFILMRFWNQKLTAICPHCKAFVVIPNN